MNDFLTDPAAVFTGLLLVFVGAIVLLFVTFGPEPDADQEANHWLDDFREAPTQVIRPVLEGEIVSGALLPPDCVPAPFLGAVVEPEPDPLTAPLPALGRPLEDAHTFDRVVWSLALDMPPVGRYELVGAA